MKTISKNDKDMKKQIEKEWILERKKEELERLGISISDVILCEANKSNFIPFKDKIEIAIKMLKNMTSSNALKCVVSNHATTKSCLSQENLRHSLAKAKGEKQ